MLGLMMVSHSRRLESFDAVGGASGSRARARRRPELRAAVEIAVEVDEALHEACRGRGRFDLELAEGLAVLGDGERLLRLGYTRVTDYARERLGMPGRTTQAALRLGRGLLTRPLLRQAIHEGVLSARKAQTILSVAQGPDEAAWVSLAALLPIRSLETMVRALGADAGDEEIAWESLIFLLSPEQRSGLEAAIALARRVLGSAVPVWRCLESISQEFLASHAAAEEDAGPGSAPGELDSAGGYQAWLQAWRQAKIALPDSGRGSPGDPSWPSVAEARASIPTDPFELDAWLRSLIAERDRRDEIIGRLALLSRRQGLWKQLGWETFEHYCTERLGLSARTLRQRIWLERRLEHLPALREALGSRRLSYSKALVLARNHAGGSIEAAIADAEARPCLDLQREAEAEEDRHRCARGEMRLFGPPEFFLVLEEAIRAAQEAQLTFGAVPIGPGEALSRIARHFVEVWEPLAPKVSGRRRRVVERSEGLCATPGCSRSIDHLHHLKFRSRGGDDSDENLVGLCAAHHLRGVHQGRIRVRPRGAHLLEWALGLRRGRALEVHSTRF